MRKDDSRWTLLVSHQAPGSRVVSFRLPPVLVVVFWVLLAAGLGGLARLSLVYSKYLYARFSLVQLHHEHETLVSKVRFLGRLAEQNARELEELTLFEKVCRLRQGMNAISEDALRAGVGGTPSTAEMLASLLDGPSVRHADSVKVNVEGLLRRARLQNETLAKVVEHARHQRSRWAQIPSTWPAWGRITSQFGARIHPFTGYTTRHEGIDIANLEWTPVYATADGIVHSVGRKPYYGNIVYLDHHGNGYQTRYAHLVQAAVVEGQIIRRGDLLGYMGSTGRSTGTHLHYEVRRLGRAVNPMDYIVPSDVVVD